MRYDKSSECDLYRSVVIQSIIDAQKIYNNILNIPNKKLHKQHTLKKTNITLFHAHHKRQKSAEELFSKYHQKHVYKKRNQDILNQIHVGHQKRFECANERNKWNGKDGLECNLCIRRLSYLSEDWNGKPIRECNLCAKKIKKLPIEWNGKDDLDCNLCKIERDTGALRQIWNGKNDKSCNLCMEDLKLFITEKEVLLYEINHDWFENICNWACVNRRNVINIVNQIFLGNHKIMFNEIKNVKTSDDFI